MIIKVGTTQYSMFSTELTDLDANQDASIPDQLNKEYAVIRVLVQRLMEEDDPSDAAVDAVICTKEDLAILPAVLLRVLHSDLGQSLSHAACRLYIVNCVYGSALGGYHQ